METSHDVTGLPDRTRSGAVRARRFRLRSDGKLAVAFSGILPPAPAIGR
jgi:hypothetical protein